MMFAGAAGLKLIDGGAVSKMSNRSPVGISHLGRSGFTSSGLVVQSGACLVKITDVFADGVKHCTFAASHATRTVTTACSPGARLKLVLVTPFNDVTFATGCRITCEPRTQVSVPGTLVTLLTRVCMMAPCGSDRISESRSYPDVTVPVPCAR